MAKTNDRVIPLDDKLLLSLVKEKADMVEKGRVVSKEMAEVQKQFDRLNNSLADLMASVNNKKLDIFKRVEKLAKHLLTEFEIPVTTEIRDGKWCSLLPTHWRNFRQALRPSTSSRSLYPANKNDIQ